MLAAERYYREHAVSQYQRLVERKEQIEEEKRQGRLEAERIERERQRKQEHSRVNRLMKDAINLQRVRTLREYVRLAMQSDETGITSSMAERWFVWALS